MHTTPLSRQLDYTQVTAVVQCFYRRIMADPLLSPYFAHIAYWPEHERHIADFWWGLMGGKVAQPRADVMRRAHANLQFSEETMAHWLELFDATLKEALPAPQGEAWSRLAHRLGEQLLRVRKAGHRP